MPRYIDADLLIDKCNCLYKDTNKETVDFMRIGYNHGVSDTIATAKNLPTADVVERKHGRWLPYEFGSKRWHKCSVCGKADEYINERGIEAVRKFCPNCGVEME